MYVVKSHLMSMAVAVTRGDSNRGASLHNRGVLIRKIDSHSPRAAKTRIENFFIESLWPAGTGAQTEPSHAQPLSLTPKELWFRIETRPAIPWSKHLKSLA